MDKLSNKFWEIYHERRNFILYMSIGLTSLALDLTTYFVLVNFISIDIYTSNAIAMTIGAINSFHWNSVINFKTTDNRAYRFAKFYTVALFGLLISEAILFIFVEFGGINSNISKLVAAVIVAIIQFNINKLFTFKKAK